MAPPGCIRRPRSVSAFVAESAGAALLGALARALARDLKERCARDRSHELHARFALLTPRERDIFDRVIAGKGKKTIAAELKIAERTVLPD